MGIELEAAYRVAICMMRCTLGRAGWSGSQRGAAWLPR